MRNIQVISMAKFADTAEPLERRANAPQSVRNSESCDAGSSLGAAVPIGCHQGDISHICGGVLG
jgi:hypothetical protein